MVGYDGVETLVYRGLSKVSFNAYFCTLFNKLTFFSTS